MLFTINLIKIDKSEQLKTYQKRKAIAFVPLNKFFDCLIYIKEDLVCWFFNIKNLISKKN